MDDDKRRAPRVSLDVQVNYSARAIAHSKDISESGICLITEEAMTAGKIYTLVFTLPGEDQQLQIFGKVAWSRQAGASHHENGMCFWDVDPKIQKRVMSYLAREL